MCVILVFVVLAVSGCATFSSEHFTAIGAKGSALCIKGGYTMAGGVVTGAKVNDEFRGSIIVQHDCSIMILSE